MAGLSALLMNPYEKQNKKKAGSKKKRSAAQKRATKKLVALNKKRAGKRSSSKKKPVKRKASKRKVIAKRASYAIVDKRTGLARPVARHESLLAKTGKRAKKYSAVKLKKSYKSKKKHVKVSRAQLKAFRATGLRIPYIGRGGFTFDGYNRILKNKKRKHSMRRKAHKKNPAMTFAREVFDVKQAISSAKAAGMTVAGAAAGWALQKYLAPMVLGFAKNAPVVGQYLSSNYAEAGIRGGLGFAAAFLLWKKEKHVAQGLALHSVAVLAAKALNLSVADKYLGLGEEYLGDMGGMDGIELAGDEMGMIERDMAGIELAGIEEGIGAELEGDDLSGEYAY